MVGKANRTLGMLKRTFESREPGLWKETLTKLREYKEELPEFQLVLRNLNMRTD